MYAVAPPGFCNGGSEVWVGGLEYEVPQKLTHLLQCIGNLSGLVRYDFNRLALYLSFRTPIGGKLPPFPLPPGSATACTCRLIGDLFVCVCARQFDGDS